MGSQWGACSTSFAAQGDATTIAIQGVELKAPAGVTQYIGVDVLDVECVAPLGNHSFCT
jgi:hypothetical protein